MRQRLGWAAKDQALSQGQLHRAALAPSLNTGSLVLGSWDFSRHCLNISGLPLTARRARILLRSPPLFFKGTIKFMGSPFLHHTALCATCRQMRKISDCQCMIIKLHKQVDCLQADWPMLSPMWGAPIPSPASLRLTINKLASLMETMVCLFKSWGLEWSSYQGLWQIYQSSVISSIREGICVNKKTGAKRRFQLARAS